MTNAVRGAMRNGRFRRSALWLAATLLLNLVLLAAVGRWAVNRRSFVLTLDGAAGHAAIGTATSEAQVPARPIAGVRLTARSEEALYGLVPQLIVDGLTVDGRPVAWPASRLPRRCSPARMVARDMRRALLGKARPKVEHCQDEIAVDLPAGRRIELTGAVDAVDTLSLDVSLTFSDAARTPVAVFRLSRNGGLVWNVDGGEQGGALDNYQSPRIGYGNSRAFMTVFGILRGAWLLLAGWLRWTLLTAVPVLALGLLLKGLLRVAGRPTRFGAAGGAAPPRRPGAGAWWQTALVGLLALAAVGSSAWISVTIHESSPHVQDEVSYLVAARAIAHGRMGFFVPPAAVKAFVVEGFINDVVWPGELWPYWPGTFQMFYPLVLALPARLGLEWLLNPVLGGVLLIVTFIVARRYVGAGTAVLAALLFLISPFSRMSSASMMTTTLTGTLVGATVWMLLRALESGERRFALACGAFLGALINVRSYDGMLTGIALAVLLAVPALRDVRRSLRTGCLIALGCVPFLVLFAWQVWILKLYTFTGSSGILALFTGADLGANFDRLRALDITLLGWGNQAGSGLLALALLLPPRRRELWVALLWAALFPLGYALFGWHGVMYGPRYYYASLPAMVILMAATLLRLGGWTRALAGWWWPWQRGVGSAIPWLAAAGALAGCLWPSAQEMPSLGWRARDEFQPGYNGFRFDYRRVVADAGIGPAVVFLSNSVPWQSRCIAMGDNSASQYTGPVLYSLFSPQNVRAVQEAYPERSLYLIAKDDGLVPQLMLFRLIPGANDRPPEFEPLPRDEQQPPTRFWYRVGEDNVLTGLPTYPGSPMVGGLARSAEGDFLTANSNLGRVMRWDSKGRLTMLYGASFDEHPGGLTYPQLVAIDQAGVVHVTDIQRAEVIRFAREGRPLGRFSRSVQGKRMGAPLGLMVMDDGSSVIVEHGLSKLVRIGPDGAASIFWPHVEFAQPFGLCRAPDGRVFVWEAGPQRLRGFDPSGREILSVPAPLAGEQVMNRGVFLAADARRVVLTDFNSSTLLVFDIGTGRSTRIGSLDTTPHPGGVVLVGNKAVFMPLFGSTLMVVALPES